MQQDEFLKRITNYIFDSRFTRALLIDGAWGCGKSFFVKKVLIPKIEKTAFLDVQDGGNLIDILKAVLCIEKKEKKEGATKYYKTILVSMYGISRVENIQSALFTACLEKVTDKKGSKLGALLKNAVLFGTKALTGVGSYLGVGDEAKDIILQISKKALTPNKKNTILIFDDIERCQIDIIELMGFLNNLCENSGYRVVIVANEEEIARQDNEIVRAIETQTALFDLYLKQFCEIKDNKSNKTHCSKEWGIIKELSRSRLDIKDEILKTTLDRHREKLYERNTLYERTREKLIGLTVRFSSRMKEVYEDVLNNTIHEGTIRDFILEKRALIAEEFEKQSHENLRTLISLFIAVEAIMKNIKNEFVIEDVYIEKIDLNKIIDEEKDRLILYLIRTAISRAKGIEIQNLKNGVRYGFVNNGSLGEQKSYFKYAFVDEYWNTLVVNPDVINTDFNNRLNECINVKIDRVKAARHSELALFRLQEWYYHNDEEVKEDIKKLKEELKRKKYYPYEFKTIIQTLMSINNPDYGMGLKKQEEMSGEYFYDSTDDSTVLTSDYNRKTQSVEKSSEINYARWNQEEINEYVCLMMRYTEEPEFNITYEMLRVLSENLSYIQEYKGYIKPLLDWIHDKELTDLRQSNNVLDAFEIEGDELYSFFHERIDTYLTKRHFLSLYGAEKIERKIKESDNRYLWTLADAIHAVYNFGNLRDFFSEDYSTVNQVWSDLRNDREGDRTGFNPRKERTREMALRRLEQDLESYRNLLRDPNELLEERSGNI